MNFSQTSVDHHKFIMTVDSDISDPADFTRTLTSAPDDSEKSPARIKDFDMFFFEVCNVDIFFVVDSKMID